MNISMLRPGIGFYKKSIYLSIYLSSLVGSTELSDLLSLSVQIIHLSQQALSTAYRTDVCKSQLVGQQSGSILK